MDFFGSSSYLSSPTLSMVLRHMRPVSGTCLLYLLALHQLGSGFQKAWGPHDQHFYQLAVLVHNSKVRMGETKLPHALAGKALDE